MKLPTLTPENYDKIFELYKKHVDPLIQYYKVGCSCSNSISEMFNELVKRINDGRIIEL